MNVLELSLPEFLGGLAVVIVVAVVTWCIRRRTDGPRRYRLINCAHTDGTPVSHLTTRPVGTIIWRDVGRGMERFVLTDSQLPDGDFVAEPMDRY